MSNEKPKHHEVTAAELRQFMNDNYSMFASSSREGKRLIVNHNGTIAVYGPAGTLFLGGSPEAAVAVYNEVTEPAVTTTNTTQQ